MRSCIAFLGIGLCAASLLTGGSSAPAAVPVSAARIIARYPHDSKAFTEGLFYRRGALFESTGRYAHSSLRQVNLCTGRVERARRLPVDLFGEGITRLNERIYQLTWKARAAIVYDANSLRPIKRLSYTGQGWGLTDDGRHLIMSNGSATLRFLDRTTLRATRTLTVTRDGSPVDQLNELETVDGEIWANVWYADDILRIDPGSGRVIGVIDAANLRAALPAGHHAGVLNGIAWDAARRRIFVTGKNWPALFQIHTPDDLGQIKTKNDE